MRVHIEAQRIHCNAGNMLVEIFECHTECMHMQQGSWGGRRSGKGRTINVFEARQLLGPHPVGQGTQSMYTARHLMRSMQGHSFVPCAHKGGAVLLRQVAVAFRELHSPLQRYCPLSDGPWQVLLP
jgi:hypothetical protein